MKIKITISLISFLAVFGVISPTAVSADTFSITGNVTGVESGYQENVTVAAIDSSTDTVVATDVTDSNGAYTLSVTDGTYDVVATPPTPDVYQVGSYTDQTITENTTLNFNLEHTIYYTLRGIISDKYGIAVTGITVQSEGRTSTTDENGYYTMIIPSYITSVSVTLTSTANSSPYLPQAFTVYSTQEIPFIADVDLNIQLPTAVMTVVATDESSNSVEGAIATIYTNTPYDEDKKFMAATNGGEIELAIDTDAVMSEGVTNSEGTVELVTFPVGTRVHVVPTGGNLLESWTMHENHNEDTIIPVTLLTAPEE